MFLAALAFSVAFAQEPPDVTAGDHLRVTHSWGLVASYPLHVVGTSHFLPADDLTRLLRNIDRGAQIAWDASSGTYRAAVKGREIALFRDQKVFVYNNAIIEAQESLVEADNRVLVPLSTVQRILTVFEGLQAEAVLRPRVAAAAPTPAPTQAPSGLDPLSEEISIFPEVDVRDIVASLRLLGAEAAQQPDAIQREMRDAARRLAGRRVVVIDPPTQFVPLGDVARGAQPGDALRAAFRVAERCRVLLATHPSVEPVLSHGSPDRPGDSPERREQISRIDALALICLRIDASPFARNSGFRIYTAHEATHPAALRLRGQPLEPTSLPASMQYLPYQEAGLALTRLLGGELAQQGMASAPDRYHLAPFHDLRRAPTASATITLGYWNNDTDRAFLESEEGVEKTARALARAIVQFVHWVEEKAQETPQ